METPSLMEPMLPEEGNRLLEDLATDLVAKASRRAAIGDLVRSMNCYYSNLIEAHHTHPRDIDRAMAADFSSDPEKRILQLEAKAHIDVQPHRQWGRRHAAFRRHHLLDSPVL
jgi:hypothetical protein